MARKGLTLLEVLVVVGVISLLMALLIPALVRVRNQAQGTVCVQNLKTLSFAWLLYKDDNNDRIVGGQVGKYPHDWVQRPTGAGSMLERQKEGIRQGTLYRYAGSDVGLYRCPADQRKLIPGQIAYCSYSIAAGANGESWQDAYIQAERYSEILQPATKYIFVEEADPRGWNRGSWVLNPHGDTWVDPLAIWHSRARGTLGYADGHAEIHHWVDASSMEMSRKQEFFYPVPAGQGADLQFMIGGFPQKIADTSLPSRNVRPAL